LRGATSQYHAPDQSRHLDHSTANTIFRNFAGCFFKVPTLVSVPKHRLPKTAQAMALKRPEFTRAVHWIVLAFRSAFSRRRLTLGDFQSRIQVNSQSAYRMSAFFRRHAISWNAFASKTMQTVKH
jgi:hypothetical protein